MPEMTATLEPLGQQILAAFRPGHEDWRTAGGIARATGLSRESVESYVRGNPEVFEVSPLKPGGLCLYGLRHSFIDRVRDPIADGTYDSSANPNAAAEALADQI